jgi:hypothetical protein
LNSSFSCSGVTKGAVKEKADMVSRSRDGGLYSVAAARSSD